MSAMDNLIFGFNILFTPSILFACFIGVFVGTLIGVLPGIGPVGTMAILLPVTYSMGPTTAIILLSGIYYGAQYGGSTTSILVNIPGELGSIVTCLDGYQMARQGRSGPALGMCAIGSFIGGTVSIIGLIFLTPSLAKLAIGFGPPELFSLILLGLMMVTSLGTGSVLKSMMMATMGMFISTIGKESIMGYGRFTLGSITLADGLGLAPVAVGMFGIGELLTNIEELKKQEVFKTTIRNLLPTLKDWLDCRWTFMRATILGFFLGIFPGGGVTVATFFAYGLEKRCSKHPEKFGTGVIEGVCAPETANNAATSGSMVPLLALGVPPNSVMAMLLGALIVHGIQPGPFFISEHPDLFWGIIASLIIGNVMLLILNLPLIGLWVQLLKVPHRLLFPLIITFCFIGVYSLNNNIFELFIMIIFGFLGYLTQKIKYPPGPFLLGLVLGPMLEVSLRQSMTISQGDPAIFIQRPLSAGLLIIMLLIIVWVSVQAVRKQRSTQKSMVGG
jgi:putative tricarboxylic transport membrane protein